MPFKNKWMHRMFAGLLCLVMLFLILPQTVSAAGPIETDRDGSLTVQYRHQTAPLSGVAFQLYRVAQVSSTVDFTLTNPFDSYAVNLEGLDSAGWKALADTLAGYVLRDAIAPMDSGTTDASGLLSFPRQQQRMIAGLYLVIGQESVEDRTTYIPEPFLISLPNLTPTDAWEYDVTVQPKYEIQVDPPATQELKALKVWKDTGYEQERPKEITVQLLRDGMVHDTVTLNANNNWRHTWTSLDSSYSWHVVEQQVPKDYTVSVSKEGVTTVITNTFRPTQPPPPDKEKPPKLPQTGMLWWPVPVLAVVGLVVFVIGWSKRREKDETHV